MRLQFSLIILFSLLYKTAFPIQPTIVERNNNKDIKSTIAWKAESSTSNSGIMVSYTEFNKEGNKIVTENYNSDGSFSERITYSYNDAGNLTEEVNYKLPPKAKNQIFYYDKNKEKKTFLDLSNLIVNYRNKLVYDKKGNIIENIKYNAEDEIKSRLIYEYTNSGKLLLEINANSDSTVFSKKNNKYNIDGNLSETALLRFYSIDAEKQYIYDEKNNKIEEKSFTSGNTFSGQSFDESHNSAELEIMNSDGSIFNRTTYKYNEKREQIEKTSYNTDGSIIQRLTFKFDDKGNTIETKEYRDHQTIFAINRTDYDERGNLIKVNDMQSFSVSAGYIEFEYNEIGKLVNEIRHTAENTIEETITYGYSENGNIIRETCEKSNGSQGYKRTFLYNNSQEIIEEAWFFDDNASNSRKTFQYDSKGNKIREENHDITNGKPEAINFTYKFQ